MTAMYLPALAENGLSHYIREVSKFPLLTQEDEYMHGKRLQTQNDLASAHILVTSHLRLVVKIAAGFRGYGLPLADLVAEGNIGLMQAVKKFDPDKGFRLSTYAMWWIKASINEYILRSWSLVKMGTTAAQKKLFFNLRRMKNRIIASEDRNLLPEEISSIARDLDVTELDVVEMDQRLTGYDPSLNRTMSDDGDAEWIDFLEDTGKNQEELLSDYQNRTSRTALLNRALDELNDRERDIIQSRQLSEEPLTLEDLSQKYGVSRERVRQIEARAMEKLQQSVLSYSEPKLLAA